MRKAQPTLLKGQIRDIGVKHPKEFTNSWVMTSRAGGSNGSSRNITYGKQNYLTSIMSPTGRTKAEAEERPAFSSLLYREADGLNDLLKPFSFCFLSSFNGEKKNQGSIIPRKSSWRWAPHAGDGNRSCQQPSYKSSKRSRAQFGMQESIKLSFTLNKVARLWIFFSGGGVRHDT